MIILVLIILGLCLGSFINALVWRIREQAKTKKKLTKQNNNLSILNGRSVCVHCGHKLASKDLIPVISWLWLRGKCRYCQKPISWQYPVVELCTALLFLVSFLWWPKQFLAEQPFLLAIWLAQLVVLIALAVYDVRWFLLPNRLMIILAGLVGLQLLVELLTVESLSYWFFSNIGGMLVGGGIFWLIFQLSKGKWIGGGDVKLGFLFGLIVGHASLSFLVIFIASLIGTFLALPLLLVGRMKTTSKLPFGPMLITATILVKIFGTGLVNWYKTQIGL